MKLGSKHVILIVSALATVVLLYILPTPNSRHRHVDMGEEKNQTDGHEGHQHEPGTKQERSAKAGDFKNLNIEQKIDLAVKILNERKQPPMVAIGLLKDVIKEDPDNERALYTLGIGALRTSQFEKAIGRFKSLVKVQPESEIYWHLLAQSYDLHGDKGEAIEAYKTFITFATDSNEATAAKKRIKALKK